jgi:glutamate dehydrogenase
VTHVVNSMVNRVGSTFVHRLMESTGARSEEIVRAYLLTREIFDYVPLWQAIEALDNKVDDAVQAEMLTEAGRLTVRATSWMLRSARLDAPMRVMIETFRPGVESLYAHLPELLDSQARTRIEEPAARWMQAGVPAEIANRVAALDILFAALDVVEIAQDAKRPVETVAGVYFRLGSKLGLGWLRERVGKIVGDSHWHTLAKGAMRDDLAAVQRTLARNVLAGGEGDQATNLVGAWEGRSASPLDRASRLLGELRATGTPDLAMLSVALRELRNLV